MNLLIISYAYRPAPYARAYRWAAIAEHWVKQGHHVSVLCAPFPGSPARELFGGVDIHRASGGIFARGRARLGHVATEIASLAQKETPPPARVSLLKRVHDLTWKRLYWPDYACVWYPAARRAARSLVRATSYDALITVSVPFTDHLVGSAVKAVRPQLRWLVDIGDPFSFVEGAPPNNAALYGRLNFKAEARVLAAADAIAVTTEPTRMAYARLFPAAAHKITVIPPLLSVNNNGVDRSAFFPPANGRRRLVFAGTFYRTIRSPDFLLRLFAGLVARDPTLELHVLGSVHDAHDIFAQYRHLLGRNLFLHGIVDRGQAQRAINEADVLVNIGNDNLYQLPSKVVEYAYAAKPILNVVRTEHDSSHEFFRFHSACLSLVANRAPTDEQLQAVLAFIRDARIKDPSAIRQALAGFRIDAVAAQYEKLL